MELMLQCFKFSHDYGIFSHERLNKSELCPTSNYSNDTKRSWIEPQIQCDGSFQDAVCNFTFV
jgi:hypothetical protein